MFERVCKSAFSYDDKRYVMDDGVSTLAFGHHRIPNTDGEETCIFPPLDGKNLDEGKD